MPLGQYAQQALISTASGAATGNPLGLALGVGGGLVSLLGGLFASGDSPQEEAYTEIFNMLKEYMPELKKEAYSKSEIKSIVNSMQQMYRGAADVAAGKIGSAIGESGVAKGQGFADYYTQSLAPVIAQGEYGAAGAEQFGVEAYSNINNQTKNRVLQALGLMTSGAAGLSSMTDAQKGISGFLQTGNLLATAGGNIADMYKNLNTRQPRVDQNGNIIY